VVRLNAMTPSNDADCDIRLVVRGLSRASSWSATGGGAQGRTAPLSGDLWGRYTHTHICANVGFLSSGAR
jgi:hypothetical protein